MELNFKLTYDIPEELIKSLGVTNDTLFSAYFCDGRLYVETVDEEDLEEDCEEDEDFTEDYKDGYTDGYYAAMHGEETPEQLFGECDFCDDCEDCPYYCNACGQCNKDWEDEDDE